MAGQTSPVPGTVDASTATEAPGTAEAEAAGSPEIETTPGSAPQKDGTRPAGDAEQAQPASAAHDALAASSARKDETRPAGDAEGAQPANAAHGASPASSAQKAAESAGSTVLREPAGSTAVQESAGSTVVREAADDGDERTTAAGRSGPVTVLYVAGMPRSGSTLLDLMLGQFVDHCDVGELFYLWQSGVERNFRCACGEHFDQCTFWTEVGQKAYGGWSTLDVAEIRKLQRRVDATARLPLILNPQARPSFRRDLDRYTELLTALYRAIADVSGAKVVVDSTKRPSLAYILARAPEIDLRMVHVLRDPRGVAYSWSQVVELPEGTSTKGRMNQRSARLTARRWVTVNAMIAALGRRGVPRATLRYEDLVRDPRGELNRVAELTADVTGVKDPLEFLHGNEFEQVGSHAVAGGRIRMRTGPIALALDEKWRREYGASRRRMVAAMTWPLRRVYGYR